MSPDSVNLSFIVSNALATPEMAISRPSRHPSGATPPNSSGASRNYSGAGNSGRRLCPQAVFHMFGYLITKICA